MSEKNEEVLELSIDKQIEEFSSLQFTIEEIAIIVGLPEQQIINNYMENVDRGRLLAEAEVRRSMLQLAKVGSTPAQKEFAALLRRAKSDRLKSCIKKQT